MITPFDPEQITPDVSLNRVWIMDLPGLALDADIRGQRAGELLAVRAVAALVRQHAAALRLTAAHLADEVGLPLVLDRCLWSIDPAVRAAAEAIAQQFGRRLGAMVLTLKRGDEVNRAARPEWDDSYWGYWAGIRQIWVGGGLMSGRLGPLAVETAAALLVAGGVSDCTLTLAARPGSLPLLGAAQAAQPKGGAGVLNLLRTKTVIKRGMARAVSLHFTTAGVLDFGGTTMKRGVALYMAERLMEVRLLPSVPTDFMALESLTQTAQWTRLAARMVAVLAATWQAAAAEAWSCAPVLTASIACYVRDNQPMLYQRGLYSELSALSPNLGAWLGARVSAAVGRRITMRLIHDGTAAAQLYAGTPHSAVITLGTALGVGFPPRV